MALWGTIINAAAIIAGGLLGLLLNRMREGIRNTVMQGIGMALVVLGLSMALKSSNFLLVVASLVVGGIIGELLQIEKRLERLGGHLERAVELLAKAGRRRRRIRGQLAGQGLVQPVLLEESEPVMMAVSTSSEDTMTGKPAAERNGAKAEAESQPRQGRIAAAFVNTTLIYCVGAMAILGALDGGLRGQHDILYTKSMLDGFTAIIFASTMGIGVIFSSIPVFLYQGIIALAASGIASLIQQELLNEIILQITAVGGILIMGIGVNLLDIRKINVANLLPSLLVAALAVLAMQWG